MSNVAERLLITNQTDIRTLFRHKRYCTHFIVQIAIVTVIIFSRLLFIYTIVPRLLQRVRVAQESRHAILQRYCVGMKLISLQHR